MLLLKIQEPELDIIGVFEESWGKILDALAPLRCKYYPKISPSSTLHQRFPTPSRRKGRRDSAPREDPPPRMKLPAPPEPHYKADGSNSKCKAYLRLMDDVWRASAFKDCARPMLSTIADDLSPAELMRMVTEAVHRVGHWLLQVEKSRVLERSRQRDQATPSPAHTFDNDNDRVLSLVFNTMVDMVGSGATNSGNLTRY